MRTFCLFLFSLLLPIPAGAATLHVPADYATIQGAINAASPGDEVRVDPGTYVENLDFLGKAVAVIGEQGADHTFVDGNLATVVTFASGEGLDSALDGFTLYNGTGTLDSSYAPGEWYGGGIFCKGASPTLRSCVVYDNES
jgi:hypothetical protein